MQDQLQKAINLVKKTGDKLIVYDSSKPDNTFVILALKDYENLVLGKSEVRGLTEDELLDKIYVKLFFLSNSIIPKNILVTIISPEASS